MRFQEELTRSFRSIAAVEPRRYVLRQIGDLPLTVDFDEVVGLLRDEEAGAGPLAPMATTTLTRLLPRWLAAGYGIDVRAESPGSLIAPRDASRSGKTPVPFAPPSWVAVLPPAAPSRGLENETWVSAGSHLLEGCVEPLIAAARGAEPVARASALRCLARLLHHHARQFLRDRAAEDGDAALALAATGDPEALPILVEQLRRPGAPRAELVRLLDRYPSIEAVREIRSALKGGEPDLRLSGAIALEGLADQEPLLLARPLLEAWTERWPLVQLVDSLGRAAGRDAVPDLVRLYQNSTDMLVRVAAVRSIVNLGGDEAGQFCVSLLDTGSEPVKAIVLGGLVQLGFQPEELRAKLLELADSLHSRLALNAAIALATVEPAESTRRAVAWLRDDDEVIREQGAFLLGYLPSETALKVSSRLARADKVSAVRMELLRALAKYPPAQAGEALSACLDQPDPVVRARAVRLRAQAGDLQPGDLTETLRGLLNAETDPVVRAELLLQLGQSGDPSAHGALMADVDAPDQRVAIAACHAIGATGHQPLSSGLARVSVSSPPAVRARAALALFALADTSAFSQLKALLTGTPAEVSAGAQAVEEIILLLPRLPASPRHLPLRQLLSGHLRTPEYEDFSRERLGIRPAARAPVVRAFQDVQVEARPAAPNSATNNAAQILAELVSSGVRPVTRDPGSGRTPRPGSAPDRSRTRPEVAATASPGAGWSGRQTAVSLVLAVACTGFLMVREMRRPRAAPTSGPSAAGPAELAGLSVLSADGGVQAGAPGGPLAPVTAGQMLKPPVQLAADATGRLVVAPRVKQNKLVLSSGARLLVTRLEPGQKAGAYALTAGELSGDLMVNFSFGAPRLRLELGEVTVETDRVVMRVEVREKTVTVKVAWNEAKIESQGRTVTLREGHGWTFERGKPPAEPVALDMTREVWK